MPRLASQNHGSRSFLSHACLEEALVAVTWRATRGELRTFRLSQRFITIGCDVRDAVVACEGTIGGA